MRKYLFLLIVVIVLGACSSGNDNNTQNNNASANTKGTNNNESLEVDKKIVNVEVTIPASMYELEEDEEMDMEEITAEAKEEGIKKVTLNDDGSVTYKMSKSTHKKMMKEMKADLEDTLDEVINSDDYPSIGEISSNESFTKFDLIVDKDMYEGSFDGVAIFGLAFSSMFYQLFDGADSDSYHATFNFVDTDTDEVFESVTYPDALDG